MPPLLPRDSLDATHEPICLLCELDELNDITRPRNWIYLALHYLLDHVDRLAVVGMHPDWLMRDLLLELAVRQCYDNEFLKLSAGARPRPVGEYTFNLWHALGL